MTVAETSLATYIFIWNNINVRELAKLYIRPNYGRMHENELIKAINIYDKLLFRMQTDYAGGVSVIANDIPSSQLPMATTMYFIRMELYLNAVSFWSHSLSAFVPHL